MGIPAHKPHCLLVKENYFFPRRRGAGLVSTVVVAGLDFSVPFDRNWPFLASLTI